MYKANVSSTGPAVAQTSRSAGGRPGAIGTPSWYSKLASAWGSALDRQADRTVSMAQQLTNSDADTPGQALRVSAAAQQLTFLCTAASNVSNSIGQALETLGRKQ